jgi:hypothetical protein
MHLNWQQNTPRCSRLLLYANQTAEERTSVRMLIGCYMMQSVSISLISSTIHIHHFIIIHSPIIFSTSIFA